MAPAIRPEMPSAQPRAGYLGPEGTFSEEALLASTVPDGLEPYPLASIYDTVVALRTGEVAWAIVPIENSLEGSINVTLDLLAGEAGDVEIVGEVLLRVRHSLIAATMVELREIETVITHPHVPGQCAVFLRGELGHARIVPASSTAEAVRIVAAEGRREQAAIGTGLAAGIYGAAVVREGIEDRDDNETRFVWLARGGLVRCLDEFARREINLTKIESRPQRGRLGSYMFFVDLAGRVGDAHVDEALAGVGALSQEVRVLGSYRSASRSRPQAP